MSLIYLKRLLFGENLFGNTQSLKVVLEAYES